MLQSTPYDAHRPSPSFDAVLIDQLRRTPWMLYSGAIHAIIAILLHFMSSTLPQSRPILGITVAAAEAPETLDALKPPEEIAEPEPVTDDRHDPEYTPVDTEIDAPAESDDELPDQTDRGDPEASADAPFESSGGNTSVGVGGGAASDWGNGPGGNRRGGRPKAPPATVPVVTAGLDWLARHQSPDGSWDADGFHAACKDGVRCEGKGSATHDLGVTGLALLAFLGAGEDHRSGQHGQTVARGLKWLKSQQTADGCFGPKGDPHFSYDHAIATLAMAEAYGMTRSTVWKGSAQAGIDYVQAMQNPYKAWRYGARPGDNDVSVTGWMVMALKSGKYAGLAVNDSSLAWARDFVNEMTDADTGRTGYMKRGERPVRAEGRLDSYPAEESESLTAVGMLVRIFAGENPKESPMLKAGAELCAKRLPVWEPRTGKIDMYYWYYASLALFQVGGPAWVTWESKLRAAVVDSQLRDGCARGSWDALDPWGEDGGRVYSTAIMTLCLEVYYRYGKVFGTR